jgi:hypothetical protein
VGKRIRDLLSQSTAIAAPMTSSAIGGEGRSHPRRHPWFGPARQTAALGRPSPEGRGEPQGRQLVLRARRPPHPHLDPASVTRCAGYFWSIQRHWSHAVLPRPREMPTKRPSVAAFPHAGVVVIWRHRSGSPSVGFAKPAPGYSSTPRWSRRGFSSGCTPCRF